MNAPPDPNRSSAIVPRKRLMICCDGTWMNSNDGYKKGEKGILQTPSNVTRISRAFRRQCTDNTLQIIFYQNGVGTGGVLDRMYGGAFGKGVSENIREVYSFICANYCDGDEIVLIGFSRGAFTARSVAGLISGIGLLTRQGLEYFHPILKDVENWKVEDYEDMDDFPEQPPLSRRWDERTKELVNVKPKFGTPDTQMEYSKLLIKRGYTRTHEGEYGQGNPVKIRAVAVWDTVGSLGIPDIEWLNSIGFPQSTKEYHFYDTSLSPRIDYAFQALALDELRPPFSPALWERSPSCQTVLKQVWFPGDHSNIGGGWEDQQISNITLAWMADQLSSIGAEFKVDEMIRLFHMGKAYYSERQHREARDRAEESKSFFGLGKFFTENKEDVEEDCGPWAAPPAYAPERDRPWGLGMIKKSHSLMYRLTGSLDRKPGLYQRVNPENGLEIEGAFLRDTSEHVHSSVRTRLACRGLGLDDQDVWQPRSLHHWRLTRVSGCGFAVPPTIDLGSSSWPDEGERRATGLDKIEYKLRFPTEGKRHHCSRSRSRHDRSRKWDDDDDNDDDNESDIEEDDRRWVWVYTGPEVSDPSTRVMPEEKIGFWERVLIGITTGLPEVDVFELAERHPPLWPNIDPDFHRPSSESSSGW